MKYTQRKSLILSVALGLAALSAPATDRIFTYVYEPETLPAGAMEFEQWITSRSSRSGAVGRDNYQRWQFREELEYGVTDNYMAALYLNTQSTSYRDRTGTRQSRFEFTGISLENKLMVLNPAEHAVGLTLYLEPTYAGEEAELEQKIIIGQRHGKWKWAVNLEHATEWEENFHEHTGELALGVGVARQLGRRWWLGLELRDHNKLPRYARWENTALHAGPTLSFHGEKFWAGLTVMPQIYGCSFSGDPDGQGRLELKDHERLNVRLLLGVSF